MVTAFGAARSQPGGRYTRESMPELPEVETVRRQLEPWLTGRTISRVVLLAPPGPKYAGLERAAGQTIESVGRRGKFLLMPLSGGDDLVVHLGMTGVITPDSADDGAAAAEAAGSDDGRAYLAGGRAADLGSTRGATEQPGRKHRRVELHLEGGRPNRLDFNDPRRFGRFLLVRRGEYGSMPTLAVLGPEPLGDEFTPDQLLEALRRSNMAVKTYLLSQRPVAGVGNIYADEALWRAYVHPETPASSVKKEQVQALHQAIRDVLQASIEAQGTTLNDYRTVYGQQGDYADRLQVYGRAGAECPRCGCQLERSVVGQRGTTHCPDCQRIPSAQRRALTRRKK